jgi:hypothetical protein
VGWRIDYILHCASLQPHVHVRRKNGRERGKGGAGIKRDAQRQRQRRERESARQPPLPFPSFSPRTPSYAATCWALTTAPVRPCPAPFSHAYLLIHYLPCPTLPPLSLIRYLPPRTLLTRITTLGEISSTHASLMPPLPPVGIRFSDELM